MGVLATVVSSQCVTVPLVGVLSYISQTGNIILGGTALFSLSLGMGSLLLVIGTMGGKYLPKKGPWMLLVNEMFALILFGLAIWILKRLLPGPITLGLWGALFLYAGILLGGVDSTRNGWFPKVGFVLSLYAIVLFFGALQGHSSLLNPIDEISFKEIKGSPTNLNFTPITSLDDFKNQKEKAAQHARPMMLYFYADWCVNCKNYEETVFKDSRIQSQLKDWILFKINITQNTQDTPRLLNSLEIYGPPTFLFFKNGEEVINSRIIGKQNTETFLKHVQALK